MENNRRIPERRVDDGESVLHSDADEMREEQHPVREAPNLFRNHDHGATPPDAAWRRIGPRGGLP